MKRKYVGCENATSATARIEVVNDERREPPVFYYFGDEEEGIDFLNKMKRETKTKWTYYFYNRNLLNGKWSFAEVGDETGVIF